MSSIRIKKAYKIGFSLTLLLMGALAMRRFFLKWTGSQPFVVPPDSWPPIRPATTVDSRHQNDTDTGHTNLSSSSEGAGRTVSESAPSVDRARSDRNNLTTIGESIVNDRLDVDSTNEDALRDENGAPLWVIPQDRSCPSSHPIKAKLSSMIYHVPGSLAYDRTIADRCYATEEAASSDGFRRSKR